MGGEDFNKIGIAILVVCGAVVAAAAGLLVWAFW